MKWITALDLDRWAKTLQARAVFPGLIGDLIRASATDITSFRFASGDKSQIRGFDGSLSATGAPPFVPPGDSIWEFGSSGATVAKANGDYQKRTNEVSKEDRANLTLVIASPYTWDAPATKLDDWLNEKRKLNDWKQVEYFDGIVIESWLDLHPAVSARYARYELHLVASTGIYSTEEFWDEYSLNFEPKLTEEVLLCDRQSQADKILRELKRTTGTVKFAADSPKEVIAFAIAALRKAETDVRLFLEARTIIVDTTDAARVMAQKKSLVFFPTGQARNMIGMLAGNGPTLVAIGGDELKRDHEVLTRPSSRSLGNAIETMGFSEGKGYELARQCGRSVTILARLIPSGSAAKPEWLDHWKPLLPALLAGGWSATSKLDTDILCGLGVVETYEEIETPLRPLTRLTDPPIDRIDDVWKMRAPVDAFVHMGHLLGAEDLGRLKAAATEVFGEIQDQPNPDELFKIDRDGSSHHSDWLRDGLATTLLQIAVLHNQAGIVVPGSTPQQYVNDIIRNLPGLSSNHRLLASLRNELQLLAEAAPDPFVDALEQMFEGEGDCIKPIFNEENNFISPSSPHTSLLWALEVLAWDPAQLQRVSLVLARLASIDPGGRLSNRPINSLRSIFLSWAPNTNATLQERLGALDSIIKNIPEIGWELLTTLLPRQHDISSPSAKPKFRESVASDAEKLTYGIVWESQREIINRALVHAEGRADRLIKIIEAMHSFEPASQIRTLDVVEQFIAKNKQGDRISVWASLRDEANKSMTFADADWTIKNEMLARMNQIVDDYQPSDPITLNSWLFDDWSPNVPGKLDDLEESVKAAREQAINTIMTQLGLKGVQSLAEQVKLPQFVAIALEDIKIDIVDLGELVKNALYQDSKLEHFASVVSAIAYKKFDSKWITLLNEMSVKNHWSQSKVVNLLVALPNERRTWKIISELGQETDVNYWSSYKNTYFGTNDMEDVIFVANKYIGVGRYVAAIQALYRQAAKVPLPLLFKLLDGAIPEINQQKEVGSNMVAHYVEKIFEALETRDDVDAEEIARREYAYLPIFDRRDKPLILHRLLMQNPEFYVSVIKDVFKPASGDIPEQTEESRSRAKASYRLLSSIKILPGQQEDEICFDTIFAWCSEVRQRAADIDRAAITDQFIGHIIAHAPVEKSDNAWPHLAIRRLLEELRSEEIERGVETERHNMRGVYIKSLDEGGAQERALAVQARTWAKAMPNFPRMAALLTRIGDSWDRQAEYEDTRLEQQRLKW